MERPTTPLDGEFSEAVLREHWKQFQNQYLIAYPNGSFPEKKGVQNDWNWYLMGVYQEIERGT